jgi:peptide deformylase
VALREIIHLGDPRLREEAEPVTEVNDTIRELVADMHETLHAAPGIGLAATQVAAPWRVIVVWLDEDEFELLNPEVVWRSDEETTDVEACLSLPGVQGMVRRPERVRVVGFDLDGDELEIEAEGLAARCLQHEIDHLDGVVFLDRVEDDRVRWYEPAEDSAPGEERESVRFLPREQVYAEFEQRYAEKAPVPG